MESDASSCEGATAEQVPTRGLPPFVAGHAELDVVPESPDWQRVVICATCALVRLPETWLQRLPPVPCTTQEYVGPLATPPDPPQAAREMTATDRTGMRDLDLVIVFRIMRPLQGWLVKGEWVVRRRDLRMVDLTGVASQVHRLRHRQQQAGQPEDVREGNTDR